MPGLVDVLCSQVWKPPQWHCYAQKLQDAGIPDMETLLSLDARSLAELFPAQVIPPVPLLRLKEFIEGMQSLRSKFEASFENDAPPQRGLHRQLPLLPQATVQRVPACAGPTSRTRRTSSARRRPCSGGLPREDSSTSELRSPALSPKAPDPVATASIPFFTSTAWAVAAFSGAREAGRRSDTFRSGSSRWTTFR
eukprot:TRINITY_DN26089_c0_g1_i1.p2 TRINITY_DN26089_c0_g1~~TRINITY_DN26089_c0_g1_i1.p2  ORF type:complete len:202 (-),score=17.47 TRINITY_DN26089_c0_g1_i1:39-623(-)